MKKTLSILLAVVLMFAMAIPVLAEDVSANDVSGETTKEVTAKREVLDDKTPETVYFVTVGWTVNSQLKYTVDGATYNWDPNTTKYTVTPGTGNWTGEATVAITVTNKSNAAITAKATWAGEEGLTTSCDFKNKDSVTVESAATGTDLTSTDKKLEGAAQTGTINGTVTVTAGAIESTDAKVGTVTLSISK